MTRLAGIDIALPPLVVIPLFLALLLALAALATRVVTRLTARWLGERTRAAGAAASAGNDRALPAAGLNLGFPIAGAALAWGLGVVLPELPLPERLSRTGAAALGVVVVLTCALALVRIAVAGLTEYAARNPSVTPALGVARVATRVTVAALAVLMALQSIGVPVTPLLTTLGIGSLAVALALQDTLANFFAGLYLLADRPVRSGDYIKILDGEEGYVETIGWRSSRLRTLKNNAVIVPNQKLSQAILTNFHLPTPPVVMSIPVGVSYDADPEVVERHLEDELSRALAEVRELHGTEVAARLTDFGESAVIYTCVVWVRDFEAQGRASHELRKRILSRLRKEGIEVPLPQRVVHSVPPHDRRREDRLAPPPPIATPR
jgi:small-conductance mechanosensitive channel